ncbi:hypothetical protein SAMN05443550_1392 [Pedobacter hartonius]|uniref:Uncharacterized protein n=1 Tax=Pedobacter hartonius TaxID=425514 RepID=A0A1H4HLN9_9SPHI|nr:hypothetical protein SAMN05443550_1392 [Pedobacter hartonius]
MDKDPDKGTVSLKRTPLINDAAGCADALLSFSLYINILSNYNTLQESVYYPGCKNLVINVKK